MKQVAVIGAAGKMGSGIALLLLQEIAREEAESIGQVGSGSHCLHLIDARDEALGGLRQYLRYQMQRYAEKQINTLRVYYAENPQLVSNAEIIEAFVEGAMDNVRLGIDPIEAKGSSLIFEAIIEDVGVKTALFSALHHANPDATFFTNTSSIPIHVLDTEAELNHQIIGFHFYNPPPVQQLLEIIATEETAPELETLAVDIAQRLRKHVIHANDVAGFIGNGHLIRELVFALKKLETLQNASSWQEALCFINDATQVLLLRPMGIFQLADYVGIDICQQIMRIMTTYLPASFESSLIDAMVAAGIIGGQHPDGSQRDGFFQYSDHTITGVYDPATKDYRPLKHSPEERMAPLPEGWTSWQKLHKEIDRQEKVERYFRALFACETESARFAKEYLDHSRQIVEALVSEGAARTVADVEVVLQKGFYHLYGPVSIYQEVKA